MWYTENGAEVPMALPCYPPVPLEAAQSNGGLPVGFNEVLDPRAVSESNPTLIEPQINPVVVRDLGGWSDLSILNRYAHSTAADRKRAMESLLSDADSEKKPKRRREQGVNGKVGQTGKSRK